MNENQVEVTSGQKETRESGLVVFITVVWIIILGAVLGVVLSLFLFVYALTAAYHYESSIAASSLFEPLLVLSPSVGAIIGAIVGFSLYKPRKSDLKALITVVAFPILGATIGYSLNSFATYNDERMIFLPLGGTFVGAIVGFILSQK